ncbi:MAG: DUF4230 domain-containing protein [Nodosilinea sp.]
MRHATSDQKPLDPLRPDPMDGDIEPWPTSQPERQGYYRASPFRLVRLLANAVLGGAVMVGLVAGVGVWRSGNRFLEGARMMLTPAPQEPRVDVRTIVVQQLRGASELTTAIFAMEAVVPARSDRSLAGYVIGSTNLLYIAYGEVRAGVDLSQISVADVQMDGAEGETAIQVTLPPPKILDRKLDLSQSQVYDYNRGFLGLGPDNAPDLQELAQQEALTKLEAAACTQGLLEEANRRAELTVSQLLSTAGFKTVTVTTQPPDSSVCADPTNSDTVISSPE